MSNVKPKAGQVWRSNHTKKKYTLNKFDEINSKTQPFFDNYTFIPQNDLEWLAVKCDKFIDEPGFDWISKDDTSYPICFHQSEYPGRYSRQQHQNMRYDLGLDENKREELTNGMIKWDVAPTSEDFKKEIDMIDLSDAKVGDKFMTCTSEVTLVIKGAHHHCLEYDDGSLMLSHHNGKVVDSGSTLRSKVDSRHWLKDLPDAGLFSDDVKCLRCNSACEWLAVADDGEWHFNFIKMPKLTGDEWKLSKITIVDLRAWQEANK